MARRVVVQVLCDGCGSTVDDNDAENFHIVLLAEEWEVDLCRQCITTFLSPVIKAARIVPKSERMTRPDRATRKSHRATAPYLPKAATDVAAERPRTVPCPVKGCGYMGVDNRAVGIHKRREHGIEGGKK